MPDRGRSADKKLRCNRSPEGGTACRAASDVNDNQQSAISNQQSAISNQQSAISNQQSAIGSQDECQEPENP
jgi:hypothetical protein